MLLSALLILPVVILAFYYVSQMNNLTTILAESDVELLQVGSTINHLFLRVRNAERNFLLSNDTAYLTTAKIITAQIIILSERSRRLDAALQFDFDSLLSNLATYRLLLDSLGTTRILHLQQRTPDRLAGLKKQRNLLLEQAQSATEPVRAESLLNAATRLSQEIEIEELLGSARTLFYERIEQTAKSIINHCERITSRANLRILEHKSRVSRLYVWSQRNIITAILIFTGLLIYFIIRLPNAIVLPIKRIANALTRAEQGDLNIRVKVDASDEFGALARQLNRVFARLRDFDERKANHILELERRFRLLANSINEGVLIVDRSSKIIYANPAAQPLLGLPANEATGRSVKEFPGLEVFVPYLQQSLSGAGSWQECEILPGLPGSAVCFEALRDRNGTIIAALIVITNPQAPESEGSEKVANEQ